MALPITLSKTEMRTRESHSRVVGESERQEKRACVLDCGDEVCGVTVFGVSGSEVPVWSSGAAPVQSDDCADFVAAVQKLAPGDARRQLVKAPREKLETLAILILDCL